MIKVIKIIYIVIINMILFIIIALPLMIVTFEFVKSINTVNNMMYKLEEFVDFQSKWEFMLHFEAKVGILYNF